MIISTTTIIAGAVVVLLAVLGSLINPFLRSLRFQKTETAENQPPVSILITAHDNLAELERNLPMFLRQQYAADYQVIVVCQSTDGETQDFLKRTAAENPHLYYTYIPESSRYMSRKKLQITLGVKAAKHEWIILTEPNCRPSNAYYVLRRAQQTYGYRSHMPNVAFRKSDFMKEQGYQGNLEYVRGEYDFLVNKYAHCGDTATELDCDAWLIREAPSNKSWHNAHLYLQASRKSLERAGSMRTLMFFDHLMPHLSLIATLAVAAYSILMKNWILTGCAGFSFLLLFIVRMLIANKAIKHFDDGIAMFKLPFFEYGIIWRNLATKLRYWRADKNDFTSHKL